jgi:AAA family ATP:ADP antiporter
MLRRAVVLRPDETASLLLGFSGFFCLLCAYYLLRPLRDAMGLAGGTGQLQWLFTATFVTMLALVPVFGALTARWPPRIFVPVVYRFFALNILAFAIFFAAGVQEAIVARVFFVWISVFNLFVISVFWSVMADHFGSEQGKRLFGFIAAGGTAGALLGPVLAALIAGRYGIALLAAMAAALLEGAVQCLTRLQAASRQTDIRRRNDTAQRVGGGMLGGIRLIAKEPYLLGIVLYLLLHSLASTLLYFEQGRIVAAGFTDTATRTQFFALVDFGVSVLALLLQLFVSAHLIRRAGIAVALMLLPLASFAACAALAVWPGVAMLAAVQVLRRTVDYAIARPAREALFTVVTREAKYKAKNAIDTVVYRGDDALSGWMFAGLAAAGLGFAGIAAVFAPLAALWAGLSLWLARAQERRAQAGSDTGYEKEKSNDTRTA